MILRKSLTLELIVRHRSLKKFLELETTFLQTTCCFLCVDRITRGRPFVDRTEAQDAPTTVEFTELFQAIQSLTATVGHNQA